ncbi:MAG: sulfide/dihydroorotate dehydrogenase-like FAD/NAD-binding protein [Candidatus Omnitrophica bacterium]|nr:sulfide/dihydroorotate dehydrogenase-like FAD/NAD-binding protein [Candidatus Omnitrophota bacterium]MBU1995623.1 sulfide/dihydroorotate dehydrogenase-like FAD/NAD-binding protein [Candidatus Omnitrophota bacterium]MBU4333835.1 sulfide/dihydroorotate dehydrogenase-like FAD/NAD-binding protein [Candidatus Omnitrophota bacterium]
MFEIINKQIIAEDIKRIDISAPNIASKVLPGQFVKICPEEGDESIPLTVSDYDAAKGIITLIFQEVGSTTGKLGSLPIGEAVFSILGPLGKAANIEKIGRVICVATGIGAAQILPICRALQKEGNKVVGIIGAKTKSKLMLEAQMRIACNKIFITTEDGSYVRRGLATEALKEVIGKEKINLVYAIGNPEMMETVCSITKKEKIRTLVQLKPIMVDCVGMCGSCRVKVGGKTVMACTDGPEFDGHKVDFKDYKARRKSHEEAGKCLNQKSLPNQKLSESGILTKFLSGILKK